MFGAGAGAIVLGRTPTASAVLPRRFFNHVARLGLELFFQTPYQTAVLVVARGGDGGVAKTGYVWLRRGRPVGQLVRSTLQA